MGQLFSFLKRLFLFKSLCLSSRLQTEDMENILVSYRLKGDTDGIANACLLKVSKDKEVYLIDIMKQFLANNVGICYLYWVKVNSDFILLQSPSSVVPVEDRRVFLYLEPSGAPPMVSLSQISAYLEISRKAIYSDEDYSITKGMDTMSLGNNKNRSRESFQSAQSSSSHANSYRTTESPYAQNQHHQQHQQHQQQPSKSKPLVDEQTVNALADAAKNATEKAAKSIFSFAQKSLTKLSSAMEGVAAATPAVSLASMSSVQVGRYNVNILSQLAEGGFGVVFLAEDATAPGQYYALKRIVVQSKEQIGDAQTELSNLKLFSGANKHPNIIELLDSGSSARSGGAGVNRELSLLFPFYAQGTAWDAINQANPMETDGPAWPFSERQCLHIALGVACALSAIHKRGFAHRDVKPHNVLLGDDGVPVLTDMGSMAAAKVEIQNRKEASMVEDEASVKVSAPYRSPELTQVMPLSYPHVVSFIFHFAVQSFTILCISYLVMNKCFLYTT